MRHQDIPSAEQLRALLEQARGSGADPQVCRRLEWIVHFVEHSASITETCRRFGIARTTFYRWSRRFDPKDLHSLKDAAMLLGVQPAPKTLVQAVEQVIPESFPKAKAAHVACHAEGDDDCPLCRIKSFDWSSFKSAAFVTSIVFNLALASLFVFTAMLEGAPTDAKDLPAHPHDVILPAEETSFIHTLLGIETASAATGIYRPINYQGKLTNSGGVAIVNGVYDLRFRLYDAASGGVPLWTETWSASSQKVTATGGLFSIALGTHTAMTGSVNFNSDNLFLQVEFDPGTDGVFEEVFTPRRRFASVPYAHNANTLDGLDSTQFIRSDVSYTASGTITVSPRDASKTGIDILSTAGTANVAALKISTQGANHITFGTGAANYDVNLYRAAANLLRTDDSFTAVGTISGSTLVVSGNGSFSGSLVARKGISGATLEILGTASGQNLFATRSISGTHLYATTTFGGAGLADCDAAGSSKLLWSAETKQFSCGTHQTGGSAGTTSFSGSVLTLGDARYVKKAGDTMTGALAINVTGGNDSTLGLRVLNTISGSIIHAEKTLTSSGRLIVDGNAVFDTNTMFINAANNRVGFGTESPLTGVHIEDNNLEMFGINGTQERILLAGNSSTPYMELFSAGITAVQLHSNGTSYLNGGDVGIGTASAKAKLDVIGTISGKTLTVSGNGSFSGSLRVARGISGATLEVLGTASGRNLFATQAITGTHLYAATTFGGAGLADCDTAGTSKLLWDASAKRFSCGTDQTGGGSSFGSGNVLAIGDARYVKKSGDTMTGALVIDLISGHLGLRVIETASGNVLHAEKRLSSSGDLVIETAANREFIRLNDTTNSASVGLRTGTGDPNGVVSATLGSLFIASDTGKLWKNNNGAAQWVELVTGSGTVHMARIRRNSTQSLLASAVQKIYLDTEDFDIGGIANVTPEPSGSGRITISKAGKYLVTGFWASQTTGFYHMCAYIKTNNGVVRQECNYGSINGGKTVSVSDVAAFNAGDWIELQAYHENPSAVSTYDSTATNLQPRLSVVQMDGIASASAAGIDQSSGDRRYVNQMGDTMTGNLIIRSTSGATAFNLRVQGGMSGNFLAVNKQAVFAGSGIIFTSTGGVTFNEQGRPVDFRIEGDNNANLLFLDASTDSIGVGKAATKATFDVLGTLSGTALTVSKGIHAAGSGVVISSSGQTVFNALNRNVDFTIRSQANNNIFFVDASSSRVGIGTNVLESTLEIVGSVSGTTLQATGTGSKPLFFTSSQWGGVGIGTDAPTQRLTVSGGTILNVAGGTVRSLSGVNIASQVNDAAVVGRYAYVAGQSGISSLRVVDVSNTLSPRVVSSLNVGANVNALAVAGKYAYLATSDTSRAVKVVDISNPNAPVVIANMDIGGSVAAQALAVAGKYLYVGRGQTFSGNEFYVVDVSNPYAPEIVSSLDMGSTNIGVYAIAVNGRYAYVGVDDDGLSGNEFRIVDVLNPTRPVDRGGLSLSADVLSVAVAGRHAYLGLATVTGNDFRIVEISNPASPTTVGGIDMSTSVLSVDVAGRYAYVGLTSATGNDFRVINVSNPALPAVTGGADLGADGRDVTAAGKFAYVGMSILTGSDWVIYDINGIDAPSATIGTLGVELLYVGRDATVANTLSVLNSINVGVGGIKSDGMLSITVGSGATVSGMTGAVIVNRGLSGTVLALDSWGGNSTASGARVGSGGFVPHILFGYRGNYDTSLFRSGTGQLTTSGTLVINDMRAKTLLKLESGQNSSTDNVMEVYTKANSTYPDTGNRNFVWRMTGDGTIYSDGNYNATGADYAEWFHASTADLKPGEAVCLDVTKELTVKRCDRSGDPHVMGIISTRPAFVGNRFGANDARPEKAALVGLIGQLPAKAVAEDGQAIAVGDSVAPASKPGFIRKAKPGESTVGVALNALASGEGVIEVLITRRNQSDLVEKIEAEVTQSIAEMNIEDDVRAMVQTAMNGANINGTAAAVNAQVQSLNLAAQINAILDQRLADGSLSLDSGGSLGADVFAAIRSQTGSAAVADAVAARLGLSRTGTAAVVAGSDLLVAGALTVQSDVLVGGTLHAAAIAGPVRFDGPILPGADFAIGAISLTGSSVQIGSLTESGSLTVIGDVTIDGLATFLGAVEVKGELVVSANQAGFAVIPARAKSVTVAFGTGFSSTPVVNATPNGRVGSEWWIDSQSQTGFTIRTDKSVTQDVRFSWTALGVRDARTAAGDPDAQPMVPFHVDAEGRPFSTSDNVWNACVRDPYSLDACRGYHQGSEWFFHPDIVQANLEVLPFSYDPAAGPSSLTLPPSYEAVVAVPPASSSSSSVSSSQESSSAPASSATSSEASSQSSSAWSEESSPSSSVPAEQSSSSAGASESASSSSEAASDGASSSFPAEPQA